MYNTTLTMRILKHQILQHMGTYIFGVFRCVEWFLQEIWLLVNMKFWFWNYYAGRKGFK